jgi:WD40 repeat protein
MLSVLAAWLLVPAISLHPQNDVKPRLEKELKAEGFGKASALAMSGDGKTVAVACLDGSVLSWDIKTGTGRKHKAHTKTAFGLTISSDGKYLASGGDDGVVNLTSMLDGKVLSSASPFQGSEIMLVGMSFSPDAGVLLVSQNLGIDHYQTKVLRRNGLTEVLQLELPSQRLGRMLVWPTCGIGPIAFSADGKRVAVGGSLQAIQVFDTKTYKAISTISVFPPDPDEKKSKHLYGLALSPSGKVLASCGADGVISLWDAVSGKLMKILTPPGESKRDLYTLSFHPTKDLLYCGGGFGPMCWNLASAELAWRIEEFKVGAFIAINRDATLLAASTEAGVNIYSLGPSVASSDKK